MCSPLGKRERKFCENGLAHMTMVAAMTIYGKIFFRTQSHMILKMPCRIKDSSSTQFDLDLFTGKATFSCLYIRMGKLFESHLMDKHCKRNLK